MNHKMLGDAGYVVSTPCLGTVTSGAEADDATSHPPFESRVADGCDSRAVLRRSGFDAAANSRLLVSGDMLAETRGA